MKLKVCGMKEKKNIEAVAEIGPDYMGFIFYRPSPRFVGDDFVMPSIPDRVKRVGVFVNDTTESILDKSRKHNFQIVQLHGAESVEQCEELRSHNVVVIKVFSMKDEFDFRTLNAYKPAVDFFLFDTKGKLYGGNAERFNWEILEGYDQQIPFFLSGGIGPDQLKDLEALTHMNIHAIDVNSGVELSPGVKDIQKLKAVKTFLNERKA